MEGKSEDSKVEPEEIVHEEPTSGFYIRARWVLALMGFLAMFNLYSLRNNLSIAIIAMVNTTGADVEEGNQTNICPDRGQSSSPTASSNGIFNWDPTQQGLLLGCYFYGYICSCVPGAWLAKRYGFKIVLGSAMLLASIITLCIPVAAYASFELLVALRVLIGLLQGGTSPIMMQAWAQWAPPLEKSTLISITVTGSSVSTCVVLPLAGVIADQVGWEAIFYVTGGAGVLWSMIWFAIIYDSPKTHPRISKQEKEYLVKTIGLDRPKDKNVKVRTPWLAMITSLPLWGILTGHFATNWGNYTLTSMLPTYMATILKFDVSSSGALSALPYFLQAIFTSVGGYITDVIRKRQLVSTVAIRKINTALGLCVPALFLVLAGYIGCNAAAAIAFFSLSVAFNGLTVLGSFGLLFLAMPMSQIYSFYYWLANPGEKHDMKNYSAPGCKANTADIAPKYGGIVYGMSNTIGNIPGFLTAQVAGILLQNENSIHQWQTVFWIAAGVYLGGAAFYVLVGSGVEQPWAKGSISEKKDTDAGHSNNAFDGQGTYL